MPGLQEDQQSPRHRVRKIPSLTAFKGDSIDPDDLHPFHFDGQSRIGCRQGCDHLNTILQRRDISGRTKEFLRLVQTRYQHGVCTTVTGRERERLAKEIKVLENMWESHWEKVYGPDSNREQFQELSEELKELKFYAIFGDYAAIFCKEIKNLGPAQPINQFKQWRDLEEKLKKEDEGWENWMRSDRAQDPPERPLRDSIQAVAGQLTPPVDTDMVRFWIRIYATRNETFHCGVHEAVDANDWPALRSYIVTHRKLLPSILPARHDRDNGLVLQTIQRLQKKHFETLHGMRLTKHSKDLERRQQQRRVRSAGNTSASIDDTEA